MRERPSACRRRPEPARRARRAAAPRARRQGTHRRRVAGPGAAEGERRVGRGAARRAPAARSRFRSSMGRSRACSTPRSDCRAAGSCAASLSGAEPIAIHCAVAAIDLSGGAGRIRTLVVDTERTRTVGTGTIDLGARDARSRPHTRSEAARVVRPGSLDPSARPAAPAGARAGRPRRAVGRAGARLSGGTTLSVRRVG